jgi:hypothetical protein
MARSRCLRAIEERIDETREPDGAGLDMVIARADDPLFRHEQALKVEERGVNRSMIRS